MRKNCASRLKKRTKVFLGIVISIILIIALGVTNIVPYFAVIPDMVKVGVDYISLKRNKNAVSESELNEIIVKQLENVSHPFVLADKGCFESVKKEIIDNFNKRLGKDNRFRSKEQREQGYELEKQRIEKLCFEVKEFKKIVELDNKYFFNYRRYKNRLDKALASKNAYDINKYTELFNKESEQRYGIRVDLLAQDFGAKGKKDVTTLFQSIPEVKDNENVVPTAEGVVIMTLDFNRYQYDYQHESISVINTLVRAFTNLMG